MRTKILKAIDTIWIILRIALYYFALFWIAYSIQYQASSMVGNIVITILGILVLASIISLDVIRYGKITKCPECGRMFKLKIRNKEYSGGKEIYIYEKCIDCGSEHMATQNSEKGVLFEVTSILNWILPFLAIAMFSFTGNAGLNGGELAFVFALYGIVRYICTKKGRTRWLYELIVFAGYIIVIYRSYDVIMYWLLERSNDEIQHYYSLILEIIIACVCIIFDAIVRIIRIIIMTPLYNSQAELRRQRRIRAKEEHLDSEVSIYASMVDSAKTIEECDSAQEGLRRARERRERYYRNREK
jgi:hypothetical protein